MVDSGAGSELPDLKLWRLLGLRVSMSAERGCACGEAADSADLGSAWVASLVQLPSCRGLSGQRQFEG